MNKSFFGFGPADDEARSYRPTGLVGARAAARLAGATTSGAPTAGTFRKGDALWGQDGSLWICTVAGSPGTFVQAGFANPLTTKADLIVGGTAGAASRLGVGSDTQVLTADSTQTLGVKWAVTPANAGGALTQIAQTVLGSSAASITFSSISGSYSNLLLTLQGRGDSSATFAEQRLQFNGDTGTNYHWEQFLANASVTNNASASQLSDSALRIGYVSSGTSPSGYAGQLQVLIANYAGTTFHKTTRADGSFQEDTSANNIFITYHGGHWLSTAAITSLKIFPASGNYVAGTVCTVYGLS